MSRYAVRVHPGELHFSAAHFITFDRRCENIHGHNFHVCLEAEGDNTGDSFVIDFVLLSELGARVCRELHDGILLPEHSEEVNIERRDDGMLDVRCYDRRFVLDQRSCILLPVPNTTAEMLARHFSDRLLAELADRDALGNLRRLEVAVEEADRQWGICRREVGRD